MAVTGPDFISLQVRDLERSAAFYERYLGLKRSDAGPPHAVVFGTRPIAFAVRDVIAGTTDRAVSPAAAPWAGGVTKVRAGVLVAADGQRRELPSFRAAHGHTGHIRINNDTAGHSHGWEA
jgi:catechol 2,3-dioxygenase-like lactoylglutathione lyase family enzyme